MYFELQRLDLGRADDANINGRVNLFLEGLKSADARLDVLYGLDCELSEGLSLVAKTEDAQLSCHSLYVPSRRWNGKRED